MRRGSRLGTLFAAVLAGLAQAAALPAGSVPSQAPSDAPPSAPSAVPQGPRPAAQPATSASSSGTVLAVGESVNMTLSQGESWRGVVESVSSDSTLIVHAHVWRARSCAEGAAMDGTCIFGLKLLGSSTPHGLPIEQIDEHQHLAGKPYELIVSSCALRRHARGDPPVSSYHVSVLGWDGVSELSLSTEQSRLPMLRPYCPVEAQARPPALHSHAAVLVGLDQHAAAATGFQFGRAPGGQSGTMFVFGGNLLGSGPHSTSIPGEEDRPDDRRRLNRDIDSRRLNPISVEPISVDPFGLNRDSDSRRLNPISVRPRPHQPSDELWALDVGTRTWHRMGPPEGVRAGGAGASQPGSGGGGATWPSARSAHSMTRSSRGDIYVFGGRASDVMGDGEPFSTALNDLWVLGYMEGAAHTGNGSTGGAGGDQAGVGGGDGGAGDQGGGGGASGGGVRGSAVYWRQLLPIGASPQGRRYHAAAAVRVPGEGENLVIIGGLSEPALEWDGFTPAGQDDRSPTGTALRGAVVLRDVWRLPLAPATVGSAATPFSDALASGDGTVSWQPHATMRVANPREATEQPAERYGHSACGWQGIVFVFGGVHKWVPSDAGMADAPALGIASDLWELRLEGRGQWVRVQGGGGSRGPSGRAFHTATVVGDVMLVYGGVDARGETLNDLWALHLSSRTWALLRPHDTSRLGPFVGRSRHTAVPLPPPATDVLVFGGLSGYSSSRDGPLLSTSDEPLLRVRPPNCAASATSATAGFAQARAAALHASGTAPGRRLAHTKNSLDSTNYSPGHGGRRLAEPTSATQPDAPTSREPAAEAEHGVSVANEFAAGRGCVPCLPGTRAVPLTLDEWNASRITGRATCERCEAGWLSLTSGAGACSPCPPGTFSSVPGASSWRECTLCPEGTFSSVPGAAYCQSCEASSPPLGRDGSAAPLSLECPPGSTQPAIDPRPWDQPGSDTSGSSAGSSSFFGVLSDTYPKALSSYTSSDRSLATIQLVITLLGGLSFFFFVLFLGVSAIFRPKLAERVLRTADVPPISGGPGNSRAGGLFTIAYAFFYSSFALAFVLQFLFFNERLSVSLIPTPSELFATTAVTFSVSITVGGYAAESCTQPGLPPGMPGPCADGISIEATGMRYPFGINTSCTRLGPTGPPPPAVFTAARPPPAVSTPAQPPPAVLPARPACALTYECVECTVESAEAQLRFSLSGRFAYAHSITWVAATAWSSREPIPGRSSLRASIQPEAGMLLRGGDPSIVTLALVPTVYENNINNTRARGFQLQYIATALGATIAPKDLDPDFLDQGAVDFAVRLQPLAQEYLLTVHLVRTLVELIASLMALGSGFSFVCRFALWFYLKTMHAGASKFGSKVHAEVLRGSLAVRGGPEERHLRREGRSLKARGLRDGPLLKRYWSHNDGLSRRNVGSSRDVGDPTETRDWSESGDLVDRDESLHGMMPTATAAPWLWPQMYDSFRLPGMSSSIGGSFTRARPTARRGFMRLVDEAVETGGPGSVAAATWPADTAGDPRGRRDRGSRVVPDEGTSLRGETVGGHSPGFSLSSGVHSPGMRGSGLRRQRSASGPVSGPLSSTRRRHHRSLSQDSWHSEVLGSLLRDAHLHLQCKSSQGVEGGDAARGSAATASPASGVVPAVYSYGEGSLGEEESGEAGRSGHVSVDVADDEALSGGGSSSTLVRFDNLTVTTPPRPMSSTTGTPGDGESGGASDVSPGTPSAVRRLTDGDRMPLTPPHGHPHYTVVAGIRSP